VRNMVPNLTVKKKSHACFGFEGKTRVERTHRFTFKDKHITIPTKKSRRELPMNTYSC